MGPFLPLISSLSFLQRRNRCGQRDLDLFLLERTKGGPGTGEAEVQRSTLRSSPAQKPGVLDRPTTMNNIHLLGMRLLSF